MSPAARPPRHRHGFTLIETMLGVIVSILLILALVQFLLTTAQVAQVLTTKATYQQKARACLDIVGQDIQAAESVQPTSPAGVLPIAVTNNTDTLVLRLPSSDTSGNITTGGWDYVIYRVVPASGATAPNTLTRQVVAAPGSWRVTTASAPIATKVHSASFVYIAQSSFVGNGLLSTFALPVAGSGSGASLVQEAWVGGQNLCGGQAPQATLNTALTFNTAPATNTAIDALYSFSPLFLTTTRCSQVLVTLRVGPTTDFAVRNSAAPFAEATTRLLLRNR